MSGGGASGASSRRGLGTLWRLVIGLGSLTFIVGGCDVLAQKDCPSVKFGGTRRNVTFTCVQEGGNMSKGAAGSLMLAGGWALSSCIKKKVNGLLRILTKTSIIYLNLRKKSR